MNGVLGQSRRDRDRDGLEQEQGWAMRPVTNPRTRNMSRSCDNGFISLQVRVGACAVAAIQGRVYWEDCERVHF